MVFKTLKNRIAYQINGYFIIKNFLNIAQQDELIEYYKTFNLYADSRVSSYGVYTNNEKDLDANQNKEIDTTIKQICLPSLNKHLKDYNIGGGIFLLKGVGEKIVPMHQDWNIVDESDSTSFAVWSPLVDVDKTNGCLNVIPGSHRWFNNIRTSNIDSVFMPLDRVKNSLVSLPINKGDAVVFSHKLFHGSHPNRGEHTRPTICLSAFPEKAKQVHYLKDGDIVKLIDSRAGYYIDKLVNNAETKSDIVSTIPYKDEHWLTEERFWQKHNQFPLKRRLAKWLNFISI